MADSGELRDACGVFGCVAKGAWPTHLDVTNLICMGLVGLQHRGQESAGIVMCSGKDAYKFSSHRAMGLVNTVFTDSVLSQLKGNLGIGHTRYSTAGVSDVLNCQPFVVETIHGLIALAHNGELVNGQLLKQKILRHGVGLTTGSDSELIIQLLALPPPDGEVDGPDWTARIKQLMSCTWTSYSLVIMHKDVIYAVRDPFGNRPLCLGKLVSHEPIQTHNVLGVDGHRTGSYESCNGHVNSSDSCDGWVVSSESCSFHAIGAEYYREILPGEIVRITQEGIKSMCVVPRPGDQPSALCIFEYVYFARPDTIMEGQQVYCVRSRCGKQLALEAPADADLVSTIPESATPAALGYSTQSGLPYVEVLCKNRYIGRTFIQPSTRLRKLGVAKKFGALSANFLGKRIVLVDDSIVRGNTIARIVKLLKGAGAKEVHVRIASPPLKHPCYMGINIPTKEELIANKMSIDELAKQMDADSLVYLSVDGLVAAVRSGIKSNLQNTGHCTACLTGHYPVDLVW
ncbi:hypothetical protein NP493_128g05105 [Ridgeia piscesae]|uniref:Amidophosphoribosyltransferase n=1 Tax=Ridgeia piscesae TaxID=27915 RepID=A0AAD9UGL5_RIDPI|nr:hypothetical protein NP493_128g05105 [Ridgeia piscesae]